MHQAQSSAPRPPLQGQSIAEVPITCSSKRRTPHMAHTSADACRHHLRGSGALHGARALRRLPRPLHRRERGRWGGRRVVAALAVAGAVVGVAAGAGRCSLLAPAAGRRGGCLQSKAASLMLLPPSSKLCLLRMTGAAGQCVTVRCMPHCGVYGRPVLQR